MSDIERAAEVGAAALARPEPAPVCVGDVLYDHDWTPIEAARTVLEAVNYEGVVEAVRKHHDEWVAHNSNQAREMWPRDRELWITVLGPEAGGQ